MDVERDVAQLAAEVRVDPDYVVVDAVTGLGAELGGDVDDGPARADRHYRVRGRALDVDADVLGGVADRVDERLWSRQRAGGSRRRADRRLALDDAHAGVEDVGLVDALSVAAKRELRAAGDRVGVAAVAEARPGDGEVDVVPAQVALLHGQRR